MPVRPDSSSGGIPTPAESLPGTIHTITSANQINTNPSTGTTSDNLTAGQSGSFQPHHRLGGPAAMVGFGGPVGQVGGVGSNGMVTSGPTGGLRVGRKTIYDRSLNRSKTSELSRAAFGYLFMEMVSYAQRRRPTEDVDLEKSLNVQGYPLGLRLLDLLLYRTTSTSTSTSSNVPPPTTRPTRILSLLQFIHTTLWRHLFDRPADALEVSDSRRGDYMLTDTDQLVNRFISVPAEYAQLNCAAYVAGIIEGVCDGAGFPTESVTAHWVEEDNSAANPAGSTGPRNVATVQGKTVFLIRFSEEVVVRDEMFK